LSVIYQNNLIQEDNDVILTLSCYIGSNVTTVSYKINFLIESKINSNNILLHIAT